MGENSIQYSLHSLAAPARSERARGGGREGGPMHRRPLPPPAFSHKGNASLCFVFSLVLPFFASVVDSYRIQKQSFASKTIVNMHLDIQAIDILISMEIPTI